MCGIKNSSTVSLPILAFVQHGGCYVHLPVMRLSTAKALVLELLAAVAREAARVRLCDSKFHCSIFSDTVV